MMPHLTLFGVLMHDLTLFGVQVRYFAEVVVCVSCVVTVILEGIEVGTQGVRTFLKNCVSCVSVDCPHWLRVATQ